MSLIQSKRMEVLKQLKAIQGVDSQLGIQFEEGFCNGDAFMWAHEAAKGQEARDAYETLSKKIATYDKAKLKDLHQAHIQYLAFKKHQKSSIHSNSPSNINTLSREALKILEQKNAEYMELQHYFNNILIFFNPNEVFKLYSQSHFMEVYNQLMESSENPRRLHCPFNAGFLVCASELSHIFDSIKKQAEGQIIMLSGLNHATSLRYDQGVITFFDPNSQEPLTWPNPNDPSQTQVDFFKLIYKKVDATHTSESIEDPFPFKIQVFEDDKPDPTLYPTAKEIHDELDPFVENFEGTDSLYWYARLGMPELVEHYYTNEGLDLEQRDAQGFTPLLIAYKHKEYITARHLMALGANAQAKSHSHITPLIIIAASGNVAEAKHFIHESGLDLKKPQEQFNRALLLAIHSENILFIKFLFDMEVAVLDKPSAKSHFIHKAIQVDSIEILQILIEQGFDVEGLDPQGETPLTLAMTQKTPLSAFLLIEHGASVNAKNQAGKTPLTIAIESNQITIARALLKQDAILSLVDCHALLEHCAKHGDLDFLKSILEQMSKQDKDFDINSPINHRGDTLLGACLISGQFELVRFLVEKQNADVNLSYQDRYSPLLYTKIQGLLGKTEFNAMYDFLKSKGANENSMDIEMNDKFIKPKLEYIIQRESAIASELSVHIPTRTKKNALIAAFSHKNKVTQPLTTYIQTIKALNDNTDYTAAQRIAVLVGATQDFIAKSQHKDETLVVIRDYMPEFSHDLIKDDKIQAYQAFNETLSSTSTRHKKHKT